MSVAFAQLENHLKDLICALLSQDKRTGEIVICGIKFNAMCTLTKSLFVHKVADPELRAFFSELMSQVEHCGEGRNSYVHSSWYTQEPTIPYIRSKPKITKSGQYRDNWQAMGLSEIQQLSELINETSAGIFELLMHMQGKGVISSLDLGCDLPKQLPRHFKAAKKLTKPWNTIN